jgi:hypothetical protein
MIDVTGIDLVRFAQKVYELSSPQGLGFMHFTPEPLSEERAKQMIECNDGRHVALSMDYVDGRACKMVVFRNEKNLEIRDAWYDHSDERFKQLLAAFNINLKTQSAHGVACNCPDCRSKQARASG